MNGYRFYIDGIIRSRIELSENFKHRWLAIAHSKEAFELPRKYGTELLGRIERLSDLEEGDLNKAIRNDVKKFLFSVRKVVVVVIRECKGSEIADTCQMCEMHEILVAEDEYIDMLGSNY